MFRFLLLFLLVFTAHAEETKGVAVSLISSVSKITPSTPFTVGLHLKHEKGFHTYWKNPGIVGIPTTIKWDLPEGFTASEIRWPSPERSMMANYPCFGYERDVTLIVTISPPAKLPEEPVILKAHAQWMACSRECYPGEKTLTLAFPTTEHQADLLSPSEFPKRTKDWRIKLLSKADTPIIRLQLNAHPSLRPTDLFSEDGQISSDHKQIFTQTKPGQWEISLPRAEYSPKGKTSLPLVLQAGEKFYLLKPRFSS